MQRVVQGRSATLTQTFYVAGVPTDPDPDVATVLVTRADGSTFVPSSGVDSSGTGTAVVTLTPAETALLDTLTVVWTATVGGQAQEFVETVEVAGGFLFSLAELRAIDPLDDAARYPDDKLVQMRATVEEALEDACGVAFVPRFATQTAWVATGTLWLRPKVRAVRWATANGVALTPTSFTLLNSGVSYTGSTGPIVIGFEHGMDRPPERVRQAALLLAKVWLVRGPVDDRATTFASAEGGTYALSTPGRGGATFGVPEVDAVIQRYNAHVAIA